MKWRAKGLRRQLNETKSNRFVCGCRGLSLGFEKCGFDVVLANEYDPSIAAAYEENHKNTKMIVGDITALDRRKHLESIQAKLMSLLEDRRVRAFHRRDRERPYMMKGTSCLSIM
jgi:predicted RNA methylase